MTQTSRVEVVYVRAASFQAACERLTALQLRHLRVLLLRGQERLC